MEELGKVLLITGGIIMLLGLLLVFHQHIPFFSKLPDDIIIRKEGFSIYFPLLTFLIVSIVLTIIVNLILFFLNK